MRHGSGPPAVRAGDFVFLSSVRGVDPDTQKPLTDPLAQFQQAFANILVVLRAAGLDLTDVVKVTVFVKDLASDRAALNSAWDEAFPNGAPSRATVEVSDVGSKGDGSLALFDVIAYGPARSS
jgi:2-iminobutanoate/2-iminopropanoate deaminase